MTRALLLLLSLAAACACPEYTCTCTCGDSSHSTDSPFAACAPTSPEAIMASICEQRYGGTCSTTCQQQ